MQRSIIFFLLLLFVSISGFPQKKSRRLAANNPDTCVLTLDTLTHTFVTLPGTQSLNVGGREAWNKMLERWLPTEVAPGDEFVFHVSVAFIIDTSGNIYGQRVIDDKTSSRLSQKILEIVQRMQWQPLICKGKKVPALYSQTVSLHIEDL